MVLLEETPISAGCPVILVHCLLPGGLCGTEYKALTTLSCFLLSPLWSFLCYFSVSRRLQLLFSCLAWLTAEPTPLPWQMDRNMDCTSGGRQACSRLQMSTLQRSLPSTVDSCFPTSNIPCAGYSTVFLSRFLENSSFTQYSCWPLTRQATGKNWPQIQVQCEQHQPPCPLPALAGFLPGYAKMRWKGTGQESGKWCLFFLTMATRLVREEMWAMALGASTGPPVAALRQLQEENPSAGLTKGAQLLPLDHSAHRNRSPLYKGTRSCSVPEQRLAQLKQTSSWHGQGRDGFLWRSGR